jgi:hypothetical protein
MPILKPKMGEIQLFGNETEHLHAQIMKSQQVKVHNTL